MYKFSANLGLLWTEMSQIDAIYKAKEKGFDAVEFQFPYEYDCKEIKKALERDNFMTPSEAKDFGLIDEVVEKRS